MITIKSEEELKILTQAGEILSGIMQRLRGRIQVGVATIELDRLTEELTEKEDAVPAFKGYKGFPANICVSINDEVVHGIPGERKINDGDIVSLDMGIKYKGYYSDMASTVAVGRVTAAARKLIEVTKGALELGIRAAKVGNHICDISQAIQNHVEENGFSVVRQFVGHGIGLNLHEEPEVPNFSLTQKGEELKSGMVLAIEPMVNMGTWECKVLDNGWTALTKDGQLSAHFEHTVAITDQGPMILTKPFKRAVSFWGMK